MIVMTNHQWFDSDVDKVLFEAHPNNREIIFVGAIMNLIISKNDVIALANEFGFTIYEKDAALGF